MNARPPQRFRYGTLRIERRGPAPVWSVTEDGAAWEATLSVAPQGPCDLEVRGTHVETFPSMPAALRYLMAAYSSP